jgi:hypothetical protein
MHGRCAQNFGEQTEEERIAQVPEFSARLLKEISELAEQYDNPDEIPMLPRLEIR